jgi:hypothetical protein
MSDQAPGLSLDSIAGEAMFASHLAGALTMLLTRKGLLASAELIEALDQISLILEHQDHSHPQQRAALAHARSRLQSLIETLQADPGKA